MTSPRLVLLLTLTVSLSASTAGGESAERHARGGDKRRARVAAGVPVVIAGVTLARPVVITKVDATETSVEVTLMSRGTSMVVTYASQVFRVTSGDVATALVAGSEDERALVSVLDDWVKENATADRQSRRLATEPLRGNENRHQVISWLVAILDSREE